MEVCRVSVSPTTCAAAAGVYHGHSEFVEVVSVRGFSSRRNAGCLLYYRCRYCNSIRFRFREIISTTPIVNSAHRDSDPALPTPYERVEPRTSGTKSRPGSGKKDTPF